ncbi:MAG TPA: DUF2252 domain-containing protein [Thermoplasmata archaeon]|nr:DUF2252 domain-containing protein [Thermoplasmata archaeon]
MITADRHRTRTLLPIRYGRMARSPFSFFRGAAGVMARDLAESPTTGLTVQLCGDAHVANFGMFATPERAQVFDANDFDETLPGPWEWDVKRLVTSVVVAGRESGFSASLCRKLARATARRYREDILRFGRMRYLDIWYAHLDAEHAGAAIPRRAREWMDQAQTRARLRTGLQVFPKLTKAVRGHYRIRDAPPLITHYGDPGRELESVAFFERYLDSLPEERRMLLDRYRVVDVAQKVVGVGSVGTVCSVLLLMGDRDLEDPLFLQLKQATASVLEPYLGASKFPNHAQRVVTGQHLIQEASDVFLGWSRLRSRDFYIRQLRDMKVSSDVSAQAPKAFGAHVELCASALARAHARTGDPAQLSGYLGENDSFDRAIARFAETYADQCARDHKTLVKAIRKGRLAAKLGV